jgi:hypothetical protein
MLPPRAPFRQDCPTPHTPGAGRPVAPSAISDEDSRREYFERAIAQNRRFFAGCFVMPMNPVTKGSEATPESPAERETETPPRALIDAATRRAEDAEARARSLDAENRELRSARTQAALAAARNDDASPESPSLRAKHAEAKARSLEVENRQLRSGHAHLALTAAQAGPESLDAVERRAETAEARALVLEAENKQIRAERAKAILAAARAESRPGAAPADADIQLAALSKELKAAEDALHASGQEHDTAARALASSLRQEHSERLDAIRRSHAAELEARSHEAKARSAEELIAAMATANAAWKKDTEARLRSARKKAAAGLARAPAIWRLRSRVALLQAARVWRRRERERLADARSRWDAAHREALDACNRRWQTKFDRLKRLKRRMRLTLPMPQWRPAAWRAAARRPVDALKAILRPIAQAVAPPARRPTPVGDAGFVAVVVLLLAIFLPPTAPFSADAEPLVAASSPPASRAQVASLPAGQSEDASIKPAAAHRTVTPPPQPPAKPLMGATAGTEQAESELKLRLMEKIRKLRTDLSIR